MPTVRKLQRQIAPAALPGARLTSAETPESRGAGLYAAQARTAGALADLGNTIGGMAFQHYAQMQQEARDNAEQVGTLQDYNDISRAHQRIEQEATSRLGNDANTADKDAKAALDKAYGEIEQARPRSARQRLAFEKLKVQTSLNLDMAVQRHIAQQHEVLDTQTTTAGLALTSSAIQTNAQDPFVVSQKLASGEYIIRDYGDRHGWSEDQITEKIADWKSGAHTGAIQNLLAAHRTDTAQAYFDGTKSEIKGNQLAQVQGWLDTASTTQQAQTEFDRIRKMGGTRTEQIEEARKIKKPEVRKETEALLEHEHARLHDEKIVHEQEITDAAYNKVREANGDLRVLTADEKTELGDRMPALEGYAATKAKKGEQETDYNFWTSLRVMAATAPGTVTARGETPLNANDFMNENPADWRPWLSDTDYKQMVDLWSSMRKGDAGAAEQAFPGLLNWKMIADNSLQQVGYDPNAKTTTAAGRAQVNAVNQFYRMVDKQIQALQEPDKTGKRHKATNPEIQQIVDDVLNQTILAPGAHVWSADTKRRLIDLTPADIPAVRKPYLEKYLRDHGVPVTPQTLLDLYLETQMQ